MNFSPSLSLPLLINPRIKDPKIDDVAKETTAKVIIKSNEMLMSDIFNGRLIDVDVVGILMFPRIFARTSTRNVDNPKRRGLPNATAPKINIEYIITDDFTRSSTKSWLLKLLAVCSNNDDSSPPELSPELINKIVFFSLSDLML